MRKAIALLATSIVSITAVADISSNPFFTPEVRSPVVIEQPIIESASDSKLEVEPEIITKIEESVAEARLVAIINGEEVWFKKADGIYIRQKERDGTRLKLLDKDEIKDLVSNDTSALPVINAGRPSARDNK